MVPGFLFIVARKRLDLFLTIRRRFLDDRTVHVLLDRREQDRRCQASLLEFPDRRRLTDRRRPRDYWEDIAHHPAVLIPLSLRRGDTGVIAPPRSAETSEPDEEPPMERVLGDETRVLAWIQESQHVLHQVLPAVLAERDALERQLQETGQRCRALQEENDELRREVARVAAGHRLLEQGRADILDSVGQFVAQMTHMLEPMRDLAEKLGQASDHQDGADRVR
jgi:hypothetical protein